MFYDVKKMSLHDLVNVSYDLLMKAEEARGEAYNHTIKIKGATYEEAVAAGEAAAIASLKDSEFSYSFLKKCEKEAARRRTLADVMRGAHAMHKLYGEVMTWGECLKAAWKRVRGGFSNAFDDIENALGDIFESIASENRFIFNDFDTYSTGNKWRRGGRLTIKGSETFCRLFKYLLNEIADTGTDCIRWCYDKWDNITGIKIDCTGIRLHNWATLEAYRRTQIKCERNRALNFLWDRISGQPITAGRLLYEKISNSEDKRGEWRPDIF